MGENDKIFQKQSYRPALYLYLKKNKNGNKLENGKIEFIAIYPFFAKKTNKQFFMTIFKDFIIFP